MGIDLASTVSEMNKEWLEKNRVEFGIWLIAGTISYLIIAYAILRMWVRVASFDGFYTLQEQFWIRFGFLEIPILMAVILLITRGLIWAFEID